MQQGDDTPLPTYSSEIEQNRIEETKARGQHSNGHRTAWIGNAYISMAAPGSKLPIRVQQQ